MNFSRRHSGSAADGFAHVITRFRPRRGRQGDIEATGARDEVDPARNSSESPSTFSVFRVDARDLLERENQPRKVHCGGGNENGGKTVRERQREGGRAGETDSRYTSRGQSACHFGFKGRLKSSVKSICFADATRDLMWRETGERALVDINLYRSFMEKYR